jgi:hypothetical protein
VKRNSRIVDSYRELLLGEKQQMKIFELASEFLAERQYPVKDRLSKLRRKPIVILAGYVCIC